MSFEDLVHLRCIFIKMGMKCNEFYQNIANICEHFMKDYQLFSTKFCETTELRALQKGAPILDLEECNRLSIYLKNGLDTAEHKSSDVS